MRSDQKVREMLIILGVGVLGLSVLLFLVWGFGVM